MEKIIVEIKGNKYNEIEIDNMLNDYINIGESTYKRRLKIVESLIKEFIKKYRKNGTNIIGKKRNIKTFLNSAKLMYEFAEFYFINNDLNYNKYVYLLGKNDKGSRVYLHILGKKEIVIVYSSLSNFLESWFINRRMGGYFERK